PLADSNPCSRDPRLRSRYTSSCLIPHDSWRPVVKSRGLLERRASGYSKRKNTPPGSFEDGVPLREGSKRELAQGVWARRIRSDRKPAALPKDYDPDAEAVAEVPLADLLEAA